LEKFGTAASTHDDIVSALSILVMQFASYADMEGRTTAAQSDFVPDQKQKQYYDQIYGLGKFEQFNKAFSMDYPEASLKETYDAYKDADSYVDPLADLMG
jgi:hypothetical protein